MSLDVHGCIVGYEHIVSARFLSMSACESSSVVWQYFELPVVCKVYESLAIRVGEVAHPASYVSVEITHK